MVLGVRLLSDEQQVPATVPQERETVSILPFKELSYAERVSLLGD